MEFRRMGIFVGLGLTLIGGVWTIYNMPGVANFIDSLFTGIGAPSISAWFIIAGIAIVIISSIPWIIKEDPGKWRFH